MFQRSSVYQSSTSVSTGAAWNILLLRHTSLLDSSCSEPRMLCLLSITIRFYLVTNRGRCMCMWCAWTWPYSRLKLKYSKKEKTYCKLHFTLRFLLVRGWCWKIPNSSSLEAPKRQYYYPTNRSLKYFILKFCSPSGSTQMLIPASKNPVCACQPCQTPARKLFSFIVMTFWIWNIQSFFLFAVTHTCLHTVMAWLDTVCRPRGTTDHSLHTAASSGSTCGTTRKKTWRYLKHTNERMNVHNICHHTSLCL